MQSYYFVSHRSVEANSPKYTVIKEREDSFALLFNRTHSLFICSTFNHLTDHERMSALA